MDVSQRPQAVDPVDRAGVVVVTADDDLLDLVLTVTASVGVDVSVIGDPLAVRAGWSTAGMVVVGIDLAPRLLALGLPRRPETYVVGPVDRERELATCSAPLGAAVVPLPESAGWLSGALAELSGADRDNRTVAVVGGAGGAGASTLAAALAGAGVRSGRTTFLVDADPLGGGLDLVLGAERVPGWRWSRLAAAQGQVGDLRSHVARVDGFDLLSHDRESTAVGPDSMAAVLTSVARSHRWVVVDVARHDLGSVGGGVTAGAGGTAGGTAVRLADRTLLVVPAGVRGLAASECVLALLADCGVEPEVVVRLVRGGLDEAEVARALGRPVVAVVAEEPGLRTAAERGEPPGRAPRSVLARTAAALVQHAGGAEPVRPVVLRSPGAPSPGPRRTAGPTSDRPVRPVRPIQSVRAAGR